MKKRGRKRKIKEPRLTELMDKVRRHKASWSKIFDSPEDAAQEYACRVLAGQGQHQTVDQAVIDMVRDRVGRKTAPGFEARMALAYALPNEVVKLDPSHRPFEQVDQAILIGSLVAKLDERLQWVVLSHLQGYTFQEMAEVIGVTQAYIHHLYQKAALEMRAHAMGVKRRTEPVKNDPVSKRTGKPVKVSKNGVRLGRPPGSRNRPKPDTVA